VFKVFRRGSNALGRTDAAPGDPGESGGGTGVGLAVCRRIVERYGGTIALAPTVRGAAFRFDLPPAAGG